MESRAGFPDRPEGHRPRRGRGNAYVAYDDGEIVALDLHDGTVRWRRQLTVAGVPAVPTALTVAGPGRLLIGTSDGRILDCSSG
ncbi:PQQ-binding-like beta-propeller repeat protein [Micromonospora echinaurantiaca]|uniref:PQQ-binding-like beta-propeller repeat protein n=1 Tax=Micromonospora echinaurantiaca TaxID=47857 RepID=UPI00379B7455